MAISHREPERFGARVRRVLREQGEDAAMQVMRGGLTDEEERLAAFDHAQGERERSGRAWRRERETMPIPVVDVSKQLESIRDMLDEVMEERDRPKPKPFYQPPPRPSKPMPPNPLSPRLRGGI